MRGDIVSRHVIVVSSAARRETAGEAFRRDYIDSSFDSNSLHYSQPA
jgi:hypothetical protein